MARRQIMLNETTAAKKRVYFHLVDVTDGMTPETGEAGGQPQISRNGSAFSDTGIGVLVAIGNGRYYAELTDAAVGSSAALGDIIETRYASANTAECPGDSVEIIAFPLWHASAEKLKQSASVIGVGEVDDTALTPTATQFETSDIVAADPDHMNGRWVVWVDGDLALQSALIEDYALVGGRGRFTVSEMTDAPADGDKFVVL